MGPKVSLERNVSTLFITFSKGTVLTGVKSEKKVQKLIIATS